MDHSEVKHLPKVDHTPNELDGASKLLLAVADVIDSRGHCQNTCEDKSGRVCIVGAYAYIKAWSGSYITANNRLSDALGMDFIEWNNVPGRTKEEVVSKLRAVALGL